MTRRPVDQYLAALFAGAPPGSLIELRWRTGRRMGRDFVDASRLDEVAATIVRCAPLTDVYFGVLPRARRGGGRDDLVSTGQVLWADCDSAAAVHMLADFDPPPSIVVASGTVSHRHAYWLLAQPVSLATIEAGNRHLAAALGADLGCADAARILRPPSLNHKHDPPARVRLVRCDPDARISPGDLGITQLPIDLTARGPRTARGRRVTDDPLLDVPPGLYVEVLTGMTAPHDRKVTCPFHDDDTPSLHVYDEPARGWYCFGCRRGGSVYDFAALLWGVSPRGSQFRALQDRLDHLLSPLV